MIWYLLYPFRGTTEPPILDPKHPLRAFFTRYGNQASRHPVITLLISVAVATILIYPFPFLYTNNFTNGASNLPHHVWTSAQPFDGDRTTSPDVVMRSIWVHGSYMKALEPHVLVTALELQDHLLGETINFNPRQSTAQSGHDISSITSLTPGMRDQFHAINGLSNSSWFFHSPLQYWSCSKKNIEGDKDIITTVNANSHRSTSVNVTLRHSIVFAGKRFEDHRLVAADTLVITLVHMRDSPVGRQWERHAEELAMRNSERWRVYPSDGRSLTSTLYEFRFQPLSIQDDLLLGLAYTLTTIYFMMSLTRLRALKSRFGLLSAVFAQIAVSIMSSFTVCAVFKIDVSKIPREAYPLVILTVGLENIFRFINAVIMTPPQTPTAARMTEALGQTGHIALAGAAQNLVILWMLSKVVSPGVASFCTFAAIALTFDLFYLLTFFVAVLSIDVRRLELSDSLTRVSLHTFRNVPNHQSKVSWTEALLNGDSPVSTRIAGTVVMISFILAAQWHFFDNESVPRTASRFIHLLRSQPQLPRHSTAALLSVDIHQARTPTAWLRMQDHETAREVIKIVKPNAHSYIARVYDPLVFVLDGSDRTPTKFGVRPFLPAVYDFARHQSTPFVVVIVLVLAAVSLLLNYLLWDESSDAGGGDRPEDEPLLVVKSLTGGHALDVVLLKASNDGVVASVGLDRRIRLWDVRKGGISYVIHDPESPIDPFPVLAMTLDADSNWLAILSRDQVLLWNIPERRWGPTMSVDVKGRTPAAFFFGYSPIDLINPIIVVRHNGLMTELHMENQRTDELQICKTPLVCVGPHAEKALTPNAHPPPLRIITASRRGCVHVASKLETGWISKEVPCALEGEDEDVISILPLPALSSFLAVRDHSIELIDIFTHRVTHTFHTKQMAPDSLRCFHSTRRRPQCGSVGLAYLALAYTAAENGACVLQMYLPEREGDTICFRDPWTPGSKTCCLWRETVEHAYEVENPGRWEALQIPYIVGIRKCPAPINKVPQPSAGLSRRGRLGRMSSAAKQEGEDLWEVWSLSMYGEQSSVPLNPKFGGQDYLLTDDLGPLITLGKRSLGVGLGNVIKIITVGNERFDSSDSTIDDTFFVGMTSTRRKRSTFAKKS
ncbi:sterol-sensing domain of SREBP cleavage-activation-domain-containing protein [Bisporella sp. PMI_857]|nr:sterol-sensing domain of SREBP cleavage-activation-domain-containing protein [Bisporella sp. PMI_857]